MLPDSGERGAVFLGEGHPGRSVRESRWAWTPGGFDSRSALPLPYLPSPVRQTRETQVIGPTTKIVEVDLETLGEREWGVVDGALTDVRVLSDGSLLAWSHEAPTWFAAPGEPRALPAGVEEISPRSFALGAETSIARGRDGRLVVWELDSQRVTVTTIPDRDGVVTWDRSSVTIGTRKESRFTLATRALGGDLVEREIELASVRDVRSWVASPDGHTIVVPDRRAHDGHLVLAVFETATGRRTSEIDLGTLALDGLRWDDGGLAVSTYRSLADRTRAIVDPVAGTVTAVAVATGSWRPRSCAFDGTAFWIEYRGFLVRSDAGRLTRIDVGAMAIDACDTKHERVILQGAAGIAVYDTATGKTRTIRE